MTPEHPAPARRDRGFALLLVLWSLVLLALITTRLVAGGRDDARLAANLRSAADAEMLADAAVHEAAFHLLAAPPAAWPADGAERALNLPGGGVSLRLMDQSGLVNPNQADPAVLLALLAGLGASRSEAGELVAAMKAWISPSQQAAPPGGKIAAYRAAGLDYAPPGAPFQSVGEVRLVRGMSAGLFARLAPHLSVHSIGEPNPAFADPVVLAALRQAKGAAALQPARRPAQRVVAIVADARARTGGRFVREAVLRLNAAGQGPLFSVLEWRRGEG